MLPERLSNGICSLKPNEDRLAFSVVFNINSEGKITNTWFGKTIIHSDKRFAYEDAQEIIDGNTESFTGSERVYPLMIKLLNQLAQKIRKRRIKDGSIEMGGIEVKFKLAPDNKKLSDAAWANVYRVHDTPNMEKLASLTAVCQNFGYDVKIEGEANDLKKSLNKLLVDIKGTPEENMIETLVTRCMSKASYTIKNIGHYGLGFTHYSHFTSPIRRYPDLITHRILFDFLNKGKQGNPGKIEDQAKWCSARELVVSKAQRDSIKYKQAEYLQDKIGQVFDGIVSGVTEWGFYVELIENKCEGMIRYQSLEGKWSVDTNNYTIQNELGEKIRLGDDIKVIVGGVDLEKKQIDFRKF
jgi:exoribonuclease R